jgi:hypothetical protein
MDDRMEGSTMGVPSLTPNRRSNDRRPLQHLIPGCLVEAATGRRLSGLLIDASRHGLRLHTAAPLEPGSSVTLLLLHGRVPLAVAWRAPRRGVWAHGLVVTDPAVDPTAIFSHHLAA